MAPTIAISGAANVDEGSSYSLTLGAVTDPGTDTVSNYIVHWGDGNSDTYLTNGVKTHTYADGPNNYAITVDLTDEDGTFLDRANALSVTVDNVAPTATFTATSPINEGSSSTLSFTAAVGPELDRHDRRVPLLVRLRRADRLAREHLRERRHHVLDDLPVRRQRLLHGQGSDLRQGQRLHGLLGHRRGEQRRPDGDLHRHLADQRGVELHAVVHGGFGPELDRHDRRVPLLVRLRRHDRLAREHLRERRHHVLDDLPVRRQRLLPGQGRIFDKDNGYTDYTATVVVNNVAPTATFTANCPVNEGSSPDAVVHGAVRPVLDRHDRRFRYAFACDGMTASLAERPTRRRHLVLDDLHLRRQRHLPGQGSDLRQGQRLHRTTRPPSW